MGIIRIHEKPGKVKRKPGWAQKQAEYEAWLAKVNAMSSGIRAPKTVVAVKRPEPPPQVLRDTTDGIYPTPRSMYTPGVGGKVVPRPDILYRDNPEMLARELKARERKFVIAPMYNKGAAQLVTDETMKDITAGITRRR